MKNSVVVSILAIASVCAAQFSTEQCGPKAGNQKCRQNKCCSQYGWCGTSNAYCLAIQGCQAGFGRCTGVLSSAAVASPSASAAPISRNGRCGSAFGGQTCKGSTFGDCCSTYNWCGKTTGHCRASLGCQLGFGTCTGVQSSSISVTPSRSSSQGSPSSSGTIASSQSSQSSDSPLIATSSSASQSSSTSISLSSSSSSTPTPASSSSSSIPTSSSSSSVASSSSSAVSISSAVSSTSSEVSSASSAAASSSSSSLISSGTTTSAFPSTSLITSTNTITPSPSASGSTTVVTRALRAARNPSVDRTSPDNLVPKNTVSFFFAEDGTSYTTSVQANLDSGALGVLLENIASLSSVTCSGSTINLQFSDETSANRARNWPEGTILFTLSDGCNSATERGVYRLRASVTTTMPPGKLRVRATSTSQTTNFYQFTLEALLIQMEAVVANYDELKRMAAEAAAAAATSTSIPSDVTILTQTTSTVSSVSVSSVPASSSTGATPSASASSLPACGGYAPGGRFDIAGTTYQISCTLAGTWRERWIDISYHATFTDCMAFCNTNPQCVAASWNVQQVNNGKYMCLRWPILPFKTDNAVDSPLAVKVVSASSSSSSFAKPATLVTSTVSVSASIPTPPTSDSPTASPSA